MKNVKNAHMGEHLLVEMYNVSFQLLNDAEKIERVCKSAAECEKLQVLNVYTHKFEPYGVTCVITLGESHLSCHTWPEKGSVAIDIFTCGNKNPRMVAWWIMNYFDSYDYEMNSINR
tara:strand:+ start:115 stop:465 length:351 start_codon:yes stop_codon:yes gene_type:complete